MRPRVVAAGAAILFVVASGRRQIFAVTLLVYGVAKGASALSVRLV